MHLIAARMTRQREKAPVLTHGAFSQRWGVGGYARILHQGYQACQPTHDAPRPIRDGGDLERSDNHRGIAARERDGQRYRCR